MIKDEHPHPGESVDTTDKELLLVVDCPNESSHLGTHLSDATTIEVIKEIDKMIADGPDSAFHNKVKLEGIRRRGGLIHVRVPTWLLMIIPLTCTYYDTCTGAVIPCVDGLRAGGDRRQRPLI
jgi:hypothetical protein